jgi:hypothetical protein
MTPKQYWKAAYRFKRAMSNIQVYNAPAKALNGLYPSWTPDYKEFLRWCIVAKESMYATHDPLQARLGHAKAVRKLEERLNWCEQTTMEDVRRKIGERLKGLYGAW